MNSLSTLSAEKSRMEASFQADKKLLRQEKEKVRRYVILALQPQFLFFEINIIHSKVK